MKLGIRLLTVAEMVGQTERIADIGSDHALLPMWLLENGKIQYAIAGELGDGPFHRTCQAVRENGWESRMEVRQGDGLQVLCAGEVDTVVIAGMGGDLMADILRCAPEKSASFPCYILQPMKHEAVLRKWLSENGWPIEKEQLIYENEKYYVVLQTRPGQAAVLLDDLQIQLGPHLLASGDPLVIGWLQQKQQKYEKILQQISNSRTASDAEKQLWQERTQKLKTLLQGKFPTQAGEQQENAGERRKE